jgi:hypothetical protein
MVRLSWIIGTATTPRSEIRRNASSADWGQFFVLYVGNVDDSVVRDRRCQYGRRHRTVWKPTRGFVSTARAWIVLRDEMKQLAVVARDDGVFVATEPTSTLRNDIKHGLQLVR